MTENNNEIVNSIIFNPSQLKISTMTIITKIGKYSKKKPDESKNSIEMNIDLNLFSRFANVYAENDQQLKEKDGGIITLDYFSNFLRGVPKNKTSEKKFDNQATLVYHYWDFRSVNVKIFNNGKLQMTGIQNENEARNITKYIINNLKKTHIKIYNNVSKLPDSGHYSIVFNRKTGKINYYRFNYLNCVDNTLIKYDKSELLKSWVSDSNILEFINFVTQKRNGLQSILSSDNSEYDLQKVELDINTLTKLLVKLEKIRKIDNEIIKNIKEYYSDDLNELCEGEIQEDYITFSLLDSSFEFKLLDIKTELINSDFNTNFEINNEKLHHLLLTKYKIFSSYEPDDYPGVKNKFYFDKNKEEQNGICECEIPCVSLGKKSKCVQITISVFSSGNTIITGAKSIKQIQSAYNFIIKILKDNLDHIKGKQNQKKNDNNNYLRKMLRKKRLFYFKTEQIEY